MITVKEYVEQGGLIDKEDDEYMIEHLPVFLEKCTKDFPQDLYYEGSDYGKYFQIDFYSPWHNISFSVSTVWFHKNGKVRILNMNEDVKKFSEYYGFVEYLAEKVNEYYELKNN